MSLATQEQVPGTVRPSPNARVKQNRQPAIALITKGA